MAEQLLNRGTGRRKTAVARVRISQGEGRIIINEKTPIQYLGRRTLEMIVLEPLKVADSLRRFDVSVKVEGGGVSRPGSASRCGTSTKAVSFYRKRPTSR